MQEQEMIGQRFGRLIVIKKSENKSKDRRLLWTCKCECGTIRDFSGKLLRLGKTKSCGCLAKEICCHNSKKHGECQTRLYRVWASVKRRCDNPKTNSFSNYGGRGIKVCDEWLNNFTNFRDWAIKNGYNKDAKYGQCTLDRINPNGDYEPSNCRWINFKEQCRNKRNNRKLEYNGKLYCCSELAEMANLRNDTFFVRLKYGWDINKIMTTPVKENKRRTQNG